jgi:hypothetical protein
MGKTRNAYNIRDGKHEHEHDQGTDGRITLEWDFKETGWGGGGA